MFQMRSAGVGPSTNRRNPIARRVASSKSAAAAPSYTKTTSRSLA